MSSGPFAIDPYIGITAAAQGARSGLRDRERHSPTPESGIHSVHRLLAAADRG